MKGSVIIGLFFGFGLIILVIFLTQQPGLYVNLGALAITLGGTLAALIIYFSPMALQKAYISFRNIFRYKQYYPSDMLDLVVNTCRRSHKMSIKELLEDPSIQGIPFFHKAINLVADGVEGEDINYILQRENRTITERNIIAERVFRIAGSFSPMFGMMGTVIGLISMLHQVKDPAAIPAAMGLALVTTLYGLILSALVFKPISGKIRDKNQIDTRVRDIIIVGVLAIRAGENSQILKEKLLGYIT